MTDTDCLGQTQIVWDRHRLCVTYTDCLDVFDTKLRNSINVDPVRLNGREGSKPRACYSCRPTPAHYRATAQKLLEDLLDQNITEYCGDSRSEWCSPAHFVEKPG